MANKTKKKLEKTKKATSSGVLVPEVTTIKFFHIPTGMEVEFNAFVGDFKDSYSSQWEEQSPYGRMDPISTFKNTSRRITISWVVPSESLEQAILNMQKAQDLISMLYPVYETVPGTGQATLQAAPLLKVLFSNFIYDAQYDGDFGGTAKDGGLVCASNGFTFDPDMEEGFYSLEKGRALFPQKLAFTCELTALHSHPLGWNSRRLPRTWDFPYKATAAGSAALLEKDAAIAARKIAGNDNTRGNGNSSSGQNTTVDQNKVRVAKNTILGK